MLNCNSYLNNQLSKAYEAAKKVITSADIEKEYIRKAKAGSQAARDERLSASRKSGQVPAPDTPAAAYGVK